ncbi:MAG: protoporphyrinogen oxidase [Candidatus Dadabacteria bacterium]|nr:MAG: protoporphyrinogen oxidase [Candidatus Dadabacteria bacterium]
MTERLRVVIAGAGVSGLSTAYHLEKFLGPEINALDITVLERSDRVGGKVKTVRQNGCIIECGPDSLLAGRPEFFSLLKELDLADSIIRPVADRFSIYRSGRLHEVSNGIMRPFPSNFKALLKTTLLTPREKLRAVTGGALSSLNGYPKIKGDISLAEFLRRRWGSGFSEYVCEPLLAGIHGGDAMRLSLPALYPRLMLKPLSLSKSAKKQSRVNGRASAGSFGFIALKDGLDSIPDALLKKLKHATVKYNFEISSVTQKDDGKFIINPDEHSQISCDILVAALPACVASGMFARLSKDISRKLSSIPHVSTAVISLAFKFDQRFKELKGSGFLVPEAERSFITGCTWTSLKWPARAKNDLFLLRVFIGSRTNQKILFNMDDNDLIFQARGELQRIMGLEAEPVFSRVDRWMNSLPQYEIGHAGVIRELDKLEQEYPGLIFTGASYRGVGVPDCLIQGKDAANKVTGLVREQLSYAGRGLPERQQLSGQ